MIKIVFVPGNGNSTTKDNWFPSVKKELELHDIEVVAATFPDPDLAREFYWIPFLHDEIKVDDQTILVGHSSGAIAAMRLTEQYPILGSVLVGAYHTDLDMEKEKLSGYFSRPWNWEKIRSNQKYISLFASEDDPWIPIDHARYLHKHLNCEYHEYKNQGHFGGDYTKKEFPELTLSILNYLNLTK
ncbi:RBBP9/YdeN family alpha/beta hydrolase [Rickettsia bellii]|uniref:Putative hydrolase RBBP9 n=1 Tax=Rickettsia bellii str. RML Mogi TaxID=1359194 RepID=A0A0F3QJD7_RICBE|nr:alpha/beta fold hydrolase [Rickettsia bellii]KJV92367.1 putative hydrolase RBBP9 [Rickettsia bellii str. RML Mogi]